MNTTVPIPQGTRFGRLVVISDPIMHQMRNGKRKATYRALCDCGKTTTVYASNLKTPKGTRSCGCLQRESISERMATHRGRETHPALYRAWKSMRERCQNRNRSNYKWYGGRGITVAPEWDDFVLFKEWSLSHGWGPRLTLDRIDLDGPYSPENCRWTTDAAQARNKSTNRWIEIYGERRVLKDWFLDPRVLITQATFYARTKSGWSAEDALLTPPRAPRP